MRGLTYRGLTLALRLAPPIAIIRIFTPDVLGQYYVFTTFFTLAVVLISFESSVLFAKLFLRAKTPRRRRTVYLSLVASQLRLSTALAPAVVMLYALLHPVSGWILALLCAYLITEAVINESGRFFWNCGETQTASLRDLCRAALFSLSITLGIYVDGTVISGTPLSLLIISNVLLFFLDYGNHHKQWFELRRIVLLSRLPPKKLLRRTQNTLTRSKSQLVHMQILSAIPFAERLALEKAQGLQAVGSYSFLISVVSSAATLMLLPKIAATRASYLGSGRSSTYSASHRIALVLLAQISGACAMFILFGHLAIPLFIDLMHKKLNLPPLTSFTAFISVVAATFCSAVAPLYADSTRIVKANLSTALALVPMAATTLFITLSRTGDSHKDLIYLAISISALIQIMARAHYLRTQWIFHG